MLANKITLNDKVLIDLTEDTAVEADVLKGKTFHKADGSIAVGTATKGAELNIHYGDTPPEDTSMLWVKTSEPSGVIVSPRLDYITRGDTGEVVYSKATFPVGFFATRCVTIGKSIYVIGGFNNQFQKTIYCYDSEMDVVTTLPTTLPTGLLAPSAGAIDKVIYIFGGQKSGKPNTAIYKYDTEIGNFTTIGEQTPYGCSQTEFAVAVVGKKIYVVGGYANGASLDTIYYFDADTETCATIQETLPEALHDVGVASIGDTVYIFGGWGIRNDSYMRDTVYRLNTTDETIEQVATMPIKIKECCAVNFEDKIFLLSGSYYNGASNAITNSDIYCFDPSINSFTTMPFTSPANHSMYDIAKMGNDLYCFCGTKDDLYFGSLFTITLKGAHRVDSNSIRIETSQEGEGVVLFESDMYRMKFEIGINRVFKGDAEGMGEEVEAALYKDGAWTTI